MVIKIYFVWLIWKSFFIVYETLLHIFEHLRSLDRRKSPFQSLNSRNAGFFFGGGGVPLIEHGWGRASRFLHLCLEMFDSIFLHFNPNNKDFVGCPPLGLLRPLSCKITGGIIWHQWTQKDWNATCKDPAPAARSWVKPRWRRFVGITISYKNNFSAPLIEYVLYSMLLLSKKVC